MSTITFTTGIRRFYFSTALFFFLYGCKGDEEIFPEFKGTYIYVNTLSDTVVIQAYFKNDFSNSRMIPPYDSIILISEVSGDVYGAMDHLPFFNDPVTIQFANRRCVTYARDSTAGLGIWNLANYRGYAPDITQRPEYTLSYNISARDTLLAVPCP